MITEFCGECAKNILRHNELDGLFIVKNGTLHSYYYIGEKQGFFSQSLFAREQLVMLHEWFRGQPSSARMLRAVQTLRQKTSRSGDLFPVSLTHSFLPPHPCPRGGTMTVRAIPAA